MADDWKPGDLALCVKREPWRNDEGAILQGGPQSGQAFVVEEAYISKRVGDLMLAFPDFPREGFAAIYFRKIPPLTDEERDSFLADLKLPAPLVKA